MNIMFSVPMSGGRNLIPKEREFKEAKAAISNADKVVKEYFRDEAEKRVKDCYREHFQVPGVVVPVLPIKRDESGQITQTCNIFDIHNALCHFDEKKLLQKYPEDEGPGSDQLKKSIEQQSFEVEKAFQEATSGLHRYSRDEAVQRVSDCSLYPENKPMFPFRENETKEHVMIFLISTKASHEKKTTM